MEMVVFAEVILVDNACNTPSNREYVSEYGADLVTAVHGGLKNQAGDDVEEAEARRSLAEFKADDKGAVTE
jgi:hypothetical protein